MSVPTTRATAKTWLRQFVSQMASADEADSLLALLSEARAESAATLIRLREALEIIGHTFPDRQLGPRCNCCNRLVSSCDSEPIEEQFMCKGAIARAALAGGAPCICVHAPEVHDPEGCNIVPAFGPPCPCKYDGRRPTPGSPSTTKEPG